MLCGSLLFLAASAPAQGILWTADSPSAFSVTITGTGGFFNGTSATNYAGWGVTLLTSPSGLWSFNGGISSFPQFSGLFNRNGIQINQSSSGMTYTADGKKLIFPSYGNNVPFTTPASGNAATNPNYQFPFTDPFGLWTGQFNYNLTSIPDQGLPQTWMWVITISGSGPALAPEPAAGTLLLLGAMGMAVAGFRKNRQAP